MLTITFCIIARNEEKALPGVLAELQAQTYPKEKMEVLLIDSMSTDRTREIMEDFAARQAGAYRCLRVLENPRKILAAGWNVALEAFTGDAILRVDAHASIPADFV